MTWSEYFIVLGVCMVTMLICRVLPMFILQGKELPKTLEQALGYIPPAAFAALVANDLLDPGMFAEGIWPAALPLVASRIVGVVPVKPKSVLGCAIVGVVAYALLSLV